MEITKALHKAFIEGAIFECSAAKGDYSYSGMWTLKNTSLENVVPLMSKPKTGFVKMDMGYIKKYLQN